MRDFYFYFWADYPLRWLGHLQLNESVMLFTHNESYIKKSTLTQYTKLKKQNTQLTIQSNSVTPITVRNNMMIILLLNGNVATKLCSLLCRRNYTPHICLEDNYVFKLHYTTWQQKGSEMTQLEDVHRGVWKASDYMIFLE